MVIYQTSPIQARKDTLSQKKIKTKMPLVPTIKQAAFLLTQ